MRRAWRATDVGPQFFTGVSSVNIWDLFWYIYDLLRLSFLSEGEELLLCWQYANNIMFDEFIAPDFGQGALKWRNHHMGVDSIDDFVRYGGIWFSLLT